MRSLASSKFSTKRSSEAVLWRILEKQTQFMALLFYVAPPQPLSVYCKTWKNLLAVPAGRPWGKLWSNTLFHSPLLKSSITFTEPPLTDRVEETRIMQSAFSMQSVKSILSPPQCDALCWDNSKQLYLVLCQPNVKKKKGLPGYWGHSLDPLEKDGCKYVPYLSTKNLTSSTHL